MRAFPLKAVSGITETGEGLRLENAMHRSALAWLASIVLLASATASAEDPDRVTPRGPGAVFASVEAAAVDGLAWAHREQLVSANPRLSRGGTIVGVEGGYSYRELVAASPAAPDRLELRLTPDVVAHFHTYPRQGWRIDRDNERHSRADRRVVDRIDSQSRPSFILTPSMRVLVYRGQTPQRGAEQLVTKLEAASDGRMLAAQ
jgi:hypothetical protein